MCGRYANHVKHMAEWVDLLADWPEDAELGYNIAPSQRVPVFTALGGKAMRWGMIPPWSKEPTSKYATFNARCETVSEKPAFRSAWKQSQTCVFPATGYYEWRGDKGNKQPYFIRPDADEPLVMAGLWEHWERGDEAIDSCTIITQPSGGKLADLHHRMPLLVNLQQAEQWLNDGVVMLDALLAEQDVGGLEYYEVDKAVNRATNDGDSLIMPLQ